MFSVNTGKSAIRERYIIITLTLKFTGKTNKLISYKVSETNETNNVKLKIRLFTAENN